MNTLELNYYMKKNIFSKKYFKGTFPIDLLPQKRVKRPSGFICNTDKSNKFGTHWFAIFVPTHGPVEYFDSFGLKPYLKEVKSFIKFNGSRYIYNPIQIQGNSTKHAESSLQYFFYLDLRILILKGLFNCLLEIRNSMKN